MKTKIIILFFVLLGHGLPSNACEWCGNSGSFFGILPQSHRRFAEIRYRVKNYESHLNSSFFRAKENFQSAELWGVFTPSNVRR